MWYSIQQMRRKENIITCKKASMFAISACVLLIMNWLTQAIACDLSRNKDKAYQETVTSDHSLKKNLNMYTLNLWRKITKHPISLSITKYLKAWWYCQTEQHQFKTNQLFMSCCQTNKLVKVATIYRCSHFSYLILEDECLKNWRNFGIKASSGLSGLFSRNSALSSHIFWRAPNAP